MFVFAYLIAIVVSLLTIKLKYILMENGMEKKISHPTFNHLRGAVWRALDFQCLTFHKGLNKVKVVFHCGRHDMTIFLYLYHRYETTIRLSVCHTRIVRNR